MKPPLDQRAFIVDRILTVPTDDWPEYWSRDEQTFAMAEGWCMQVFGLYEFQDRIKRWEPPPHMVTDPWCEFHTDQDAVAYVMKRAEEGSPLHCRALVLHIASVIKYGN